MKSSMDVDKFLNAIEEQYKPRAHAAVQRAIYEFGAAVLGEAKKICPVETGALVASGNMEATGSGSKVIVTIGFNTSYALAVHEVLTAFHTPPTRSKFLATAMQEMAPKFIPWIEEKLTEELGK